MGLLSRARQAAEMALELDPPTQSPPPVEPRVGGWSDEQLAAAAASTPDGKGRIPGRAIVQEVSGVAEQEGKVLFSRTGSRVIVRVRLPGGETGPRVDGPLRLSFDQWKRVSTGFEVPVLLNAETGEFVKIDATALRRELG